MPARVRAHLNLPDTDQGIDLVAEAKDGTYWAVQCKYRDDEKGSLSWREISTFTGLAFGIARNFSYGLVCYTGGRYPKLLRDGERIGLASSEVWHGLDATFFERARALAEHKAPALEPCTPRPHQARAIERAAEHFLTKGETRGKLIMPCGAGKSLAAFWIAERLGARTILVAVPSLALMRKALHDDWLPEFYATGRADEVRWLCVCSDKTVGERERDDTSVLMQDLGVPCVTDQATVMAWLRALPQEGTHIVFTTYQSGPVIAGAARALGFSFDLGIFDEAHKTVGQREKLFSHLLFDEHIPIARRVFMTATERRFAGRGDTIVSMDNPAHYGETFELLTFKEALQAEPPILADYKILTVLVSYEEVSRLIERNLYLRPDTGSWDEEIEAQQLAALVALRKAMQKHPIRHAVSFHGSIARARAFQRNNERFSEALPEFGGLETFHVTGAMPTTVRERELRAFAQSPRALITNARCLTEGVDVPSIDCVLFADPKQSTIDIVQAAGRALRTAKGKERGYIIVPVLAKSGNTDELLETGAFAQVFTVLQALAANDERIIEYFRAVHEGRQSRGGIIEIEVDERIAERIDVEAFVEQIELAEWKRTAGLEWRPFHEARTSVRSLRLQGYSAWRDYCAGHLPTLPSKPSDIPTNPNNIYRQHWAGWYDWLGNRAHVWRPFEDVRTFAQNLRLSSSREWQAYCRGERPDLPPKPDDVPKSPADVYSDHWKGWGDWLGTGKKMWAPSNWRSFVEARYFVRQLNLNNQKEWKVYCQGKLPRLPPRPADIPSTPWEAYKSEWISIADWLGSGYIATRKRSMRPFEDARAFACTLGLRSYEEWKEYCKGKLPNLPARPTDIPVNPHIYYRYQWKGSRDWLGTKMLARRPFASARAFARRLNLGSKEQWLKYCAGEFPQLPQKPADIPSSPAVVYKQSGWISWGDWRGTGNRPGGQRQTRADTEKAAP